MKLAEIILRGILPQQLRALKTWTDFDGNFRDAEMVSRSLLRWNIDTPQPWDRVIDRRQPTWSVVQAERIRQPDWPSILLSWSPGRHFS